MYRVLKFFWVCKLLYNFLYILNIFWMCKVLLKLYIFLYDYLLLRNIGLKKDNIFLLRILLWFLFCKLNNIVVKVLVLVMCNWIWWYVYRSCLIRKGKDYLWEWKSLVKCLKYEICGGFLVKFLCLLNRVFEMSDYFYSYVMISKEFVFKRLECI